MRCFCAKQTRWREGRRYAEVLVACFALVVCGWECTRAASTRTSVGKKGEVAGMESMKH